MPVRFGPTAFVLSAAMLAAPAFAPACAQAAGRADPPVVVQTTPVDPPSAPEKPAPQAKPQTQTQTQSSAPAVASTRSSEAQRLAACVEKIDQDPGEAYEDGLAWMQVGARPAARQCTALALIALGHEAEGAFRLEQLANAPDGGTLEQRAVYLIQAGNGWMLARDPEAALVAFDSALKLAPEDPGLRKDRARAHMLLKDWDKAGAELDIAVELSPGDGEAHRMRARTLLELGRINDAWTDVEAALRYTPDDVSAVVLRGDIREAAHEKGLPDPAG
ncbi:MAG: tetratricopeptide repeat protein [Hyphomonadaceae bacterium]